MKGIWTQLGALAAALGISTIAAAQCANAVTPSCAVYDSCFAKYCPCQGDPAEYFITYGKKYCTNFLAHAEFSDAGRKWHDRTLVCLQEKVVPHLDISSTPSCNCSAMRAMAFTAHVACYTEQGSSMCDLSTSDLNEVRKSLYAVMVYVDSGPPQDNSVI